MTKAATTIAFGLGEFLFVALLSLVAPLCITLDVVLFGNGVSEISVTEIIQEFLLLIVALLFGYGAWKYPDSRGLFVLAAGFFTCMLVRELDGLFDQVWHGFWFWPAISVAILSITYVLIFCRDTVWGPMSAFIDTKPYFHIMLGLVVVLVFSRIFGSGALLNHLEISDRVFKNSIQEGLELFGYVFIAYGSCLLVRHKKIDTRIIEERKKERLSLHPAPKPRFSYQ